MSDSEEEDEDDDNQNIEVSTNLTNEKPQKLDFFTKKPLSSTLCRV